MINYTGYQWLLIDAANQFGLDKEVFEKRIQWTEDHMEQLEALADQAETRPLYLKAVQAIRRAQAGLPTGHLVGVDATCSGIQIMSALTGCITGARSTGLVDHGRRADAYTDTTNIMRDILQNAFAIQRKQAKDALMTSFYGSRATPKEIFGEDTPELAAFYQAAQQVAPGAWELLQDLLAAWQPYVLAHSWKLPDGYDAVVKVMTEKEIRIEVDELDHATFTYQFKENIGTKTGISLPANVTHSVDAYVLRSMHRRCNYDRDMVNTAQYNIDYELHQRAQDHDRQRENVPAKVQYYIDQYERSSVADVVILPYLQHGETIYLSTAHLQKLSTIVASMLAHKPFPILTVHDEFKSHPNHVNWVRRHYRDILADLADSTLIDDILSQIHSTPGGTFPKLSAPGELSKLIRNSEYGLC